jgi:hypothetical protein
VNRLGSFVQVLQFEFRDEADGSLYVVLDMQPVSDERITFLLYPPEQCKSTRTTNAHAAVGQLSRALPNFATSYG